MDFFKAQLARIQQQLSGLTASQKMLAAALVAIMAMTLVWWGRYAGEAELSPLLDQSFSTDDIAQITSRLTSKEIHYTVSGDRILVPTDRKVEILADLGFANLLPSRMSDSGFDEIIKQMSPFDSASKTDQLWIEAKQRTLAAIIGSFPSVRSAAVVIDPTDAKRFDGHDVTASAMVNIITRDAGNGGGGNLRHLAGSAANLIAGAVANLSRGRVTVVIDGTTVPVQEAETENGLADSDTLLESTHQFEEMYRDKIKEQLAWVSGAVYVSVTVHLNNQRTEVHKLTPDAKASAHLDKTNEETSTNTTSSEPAAEPGAAPNVGAGSNTPLAIGGAGGGGPGSSSTETTSKTTSENVIAVTTTDTMTGPGDATPIAAAVRVPRSFFVAAYKADNKGADPDAAALEAERKMIVEDVKKSTGLTDDGTVAVNWYTDGGVVAGGAGVAPAGGGAPSQVTALVESHGRDIGVVALAAFSLFMMMMMVRKSGPLAAAAVVEEKVEKTTPKLDSESMVAGEASEGDKTMEGMELDSEAVQTQQVIEQVSNMVSENPDAAANLVKRWLNRT